MSERYIRLFHADEPVYSVGSPVLIMACALLKDTETDKVLGQAKLKNISNKTIKAVFVTASLYNVANEPLNTVTHEYLDLSATRDFAFGQQTPIEIDSTNARSINIVVDKVVFSDNTIWNNSEKTSGIGTQQALDQYFNDPRAIDGYKLKFGNEHAYYPMVVKDLWICSCGSINREGENTCHTCGNTRQDIMSYLDQAKLVETYYDLSYNKLKENMASASDEADYRILATKFKDLNGYRDSDSLEKKCCYLAEEESKKEKYKIALEKVQLGTLPSLNEGLVLFEELTGWGDSDYQRNLAIEKIARINQGEKKKRRVRLAGISALVIAAAVCALIVFYIIPSSNYKKAVSCIEQQNYTEAKELFIKAGMFKDSQTMVKECDYLYASSIMESDPDNSLRIFKDINPYKDSQDKIDDIALGDIYRRGLSLIKKKEYEEAKEVFRGLGDYRDSSDMILECDYCYACDLYDQGVYFTAKRAFEALKNYKDSPQKVEDCIYILEHMYR